MGGPQFLDNADGFDNMIGPGRFAETDGKILDLVHRIIEAPPNGEAKDNILLPDLKENISHDRLEG